MPTSLPPEVAFEREDWSHHERAVFGALDSPAKIQAFLDDTPYNEEPIYRCPRRVIRDRKAHCVDGALFAATALRRLGHAPRVVDLRAFRDDDHVIAVFQHKGRWGAVSKSNFVLLRYREPIYRNLRELALTYFEFYYSIEGKKTLREFSRPYDLRAVDDLRWMTRDDDIEPVIVKRLDEIHHFRYFDDAGLTLEPTDPWTYEAGMLGTNPRGLWRPPEWSAKSK